MELSNSGFNVWMVNGSPIAGWCRKCDKFTLDVVSLLCFSCSLNEIIANIQKGLAGHITPEHIKDEPETNKKRLANSPASKDRR